jgi:hypothetical protein
VLYYYGLGGRVVPPVRFDGLAVSKNATTERLDEKGRVD